MISKVRTVATAALIAALLLFTPTSLTANRPTKQFEGEWQGTLARAHLPAELSEWKWDAAADIRFTISGRTVQVYTKVDNAWREIKPNAFEISGLDTNAVFIAITSGKDSDGIWVETWSFAVTLVDDDHLKTSLHRQVNNKQMDRGDPDAVWGAFAFGTLQRVEPSDV